MAFSFLSKIDQDPRSIPELTLRMQQLRYKVQQVEDEKKDLEERLKNERYITNSRQTFLTYTEDNLAAKKGFLEQQKKRELGKEDLKKALEKEAADFEKVSFDHDLEQDIVYNLRDIHEKLDEELKKWQEKVEKMTKKIKEVKERRVKGLEKTLNEEAFDALNDQPNYENIGDWSENPILEGVKTIFNMAKNTVDEVLLSVDEVEMEKIVDGVKDMCKMAKDSCVGRFFGVVHQELKEFYEDVINAKTD